jgi:anaerobic magnesium-protoporphyrin IX monomethyl ester cyclase
LFNHSLYKSPFTGENATYIEGTFGCPFRCSFCVVPALYEGEFSKRTPEDIVSEFKFVLENNDVSQITLWDEGTTFQRSFIQDLCDGLIELRRSKNSKFKNFKWTTRSTTSLLDEEIVEKLALSGLSGITIGVESFDERILQTIEKNISIDSNQNAIRLLSKFGIVAIGHIILGHINDTRDSIENTISSAVSSDLNFAQFYCAVPYPGTKLSKMAIEHDLIRIKDLTKYELSNPIMDTLGGVSYRDVGSYRTRATRLFWTEERWQKLNNLISRGAGISKAKRNAFLGWTSKTDHPLRAAASGIWWRDWNQRPQPAPPDATGFVPR